MRGEFIAVWSETWRDIWVPLTDSDDIEDDIFSELYRELAKALKKHVSLEQLAEMFDSPNQSQIAFQKTVAEDFAGERSLVHFLESVYDVLDEFSGETLSTHYFGLLTIFIEKFNLRYALRRPCTLCPTLPGIFSSLMQDLHVVTSKDDHLSVLMEDFESSVRDLRIDYSEGRIKTCIQKQVNLLEGLGSVHPKVNKHVLSEICKQIDSWPHPCIKEAIEKLYGFASDYPGIRHAGNRKSMLRKIEMRDLISISILLVGFAPYLSDEIVAEEIYRRK